MILQSIIDLYNLIYYKGKNITFSDLKLCFDNEFISKLNNKSSEIHAETEILKIYLDETNFNLTIEELFLNSLINEILKI